MKYRVVDVVINSDHIVSVEYNPARSGIDEETDRPYNLPSCITITTTAIERDIEFGFEGRVDGVGSKSHKIIWRGSVADRFWKVYSADALDVLSDEV